MSSIYNALCHLSAQDQGVLLNTFKLPELCCIFKDLKTYYKYRNDLLSSANQYLQILKALSHLYDASQNLTEEVESCDWIEAMEKVYNSLPGESQKEFIENMAQRQDFFKDAYEIIIGKMSQAIKEQEEEVAQK